MAMDVTNGLNLNKTSLIQAVMHPVTSDPSNPVDGQIWYRSDTDRLMIQRNGEAKAIAILDDVTGGAITGALWDAQSVVVAVTDDSPASLTIAPSTVLGRTAAGDIAALTAAQLRTILGIEANASADQTGAEILAALLAVDGPGSGLDADTLDGAHLSTLATNTYVDTEIANAISNLIDGAPGALDTLNELAAALNDDANYQATVNAALAARTQKYAADIGDGATTNIAVTHNLATTDVAVQVREIATNEVVLADVTVTSANVVTVGFATAPATDTYRVVVIG